jgi:ribonuclease VapC
MSKFVLDASAVLAVLQKEAGAEKVRSRLNKAVISAVNYAEVVTKLSRTGGNNDEILPDLHHLISEIHSFDEEQAILVGRLEPQTRSFGLSLGGLVCLALGKMLNARVLTTEQDWAKLEVGVSIELIRKRVSR